MKWWTAFSFAVKERRIRHSDRVRLVALVGEIDASLPRQAPTTK
jgi:hypothetical protein